MSFRKIKVQFQFLKLKMIIKMRELKKKNKKISLNPILKATKIKLNKKMIR